MKKHGLFTAAFSVFILLAWSLSALSFELSADMVTTGKGAQTNMSKMYLKGEKYRMEMPGQHQYTIFRQDKNVMWIVMPDEKRFMEMPFDRKQKPRFEAKQTGEVERKLIGSESINGHPADKYEVTVKEGTKTQKLYQWMAKDINFPIKIAAVDGSWSVEYKNIQYSVSEALFEIPSDFQKISIPAMR